MVLGAFGPGRLMFGSDWPLVNLAANYAAWVAAVEDYFRSLSADEQVQIWGTTAAEAYGVAAPGTDCVALS